MKRILISTLGERPSVVTEALDFLEKEGKKIDEVTILTTIDSSAEESLNFLYEHIPEHYGISKVFAEQTGAYEDIDSQESLMGFMENACKTLRRYQDQNADIYVSIAGGRKTMSALMTLAVQIYGAKELFHIVVTDPDLEKNSNITHLRHLSSEEKNKILHPENDKIKVVRMPFIGLFPWIKDIIKCLKGEKVDKKEILELLISNNLIKDNNLTPVGKTFLHILGRVGSLPPPCRDRKGPKDIKHHNGKEISEMADRIMERFNYVCEVKSIPWEEGKPKVKIVEQSKEGCIEVYFRHRKGFNMGLLLKTTATTQGELETIKKELGQFLRSN